MKLFSLLFIFLSQTALASSAYELKMDLSVKGKHVSSPRTTVKAGKPATLTQKIDAEENFIEVLPSESKVKNHPGLLIQFTVGTIDASGDKKITAHTEVFAKENEPAQMTTQERDGTEKLSLSVTVKRKSI